MLHRGTRRTASGGIAAPCGAVIPRGWRRCVLAAVALFSFVAGVPGPASAQQPPGTVITNIASATYGAGSRTGLTRLSNAVNLVVVPARTGSEADFMRYQPGLRTVLAVPVISTEYSVSGEIGGPFRTLPGPVLLGEAPINISQPVPLASADLFAQGDPVFLRVVDADQNRDASSRDTILLTIRNDSLGDRELLKLYETGPDTGEFLGFIQTTGAAAQAKDGSLSVGQNQTVSLVYADLQDPADRSLAAARFDPVGRVFDSRTGEALNGVTVRLVNNRTGLPAAVMGADGSADFPASITTGQPTSDTAGHVYDFGPGGFRFPHVPAGQYRLELDVLPGYRAPSRLTDAQLQSISGGPYTLLTPGSRSEPFAMPDQPLLLDLPIDRVDTDLFVTKTAGRASVAIGDFLSYEIRIQNTTENNASGLTVTDRLPLGFRYEAGSTLRDGQPAGDPELTPDGRTLTFNYDELAAGAAVIIRYVAAVVPGAPAGDAVNRATAHWAAVTSNEATALVNVRRDLFGESNTLLGRVLGFDCETDSSTGIAGVRIYLESGAFAVTDAQGRYHIAGVAPGAHVVQLDRESLPPDFVPGDCSGDTLYGAHPWSHLVDLQGGTVWRSDFRLQRVPPVDGTIGLEVDTALQGTEVRGQVRIDAALVPLRNLRLTVVLPEGIAYVPGSSRLGGQPLPEPAVGEGTLVYRLGALPADQDLTLEYDATVIPPLRRADLTVKTLLVCDTPARRNLRSEVVRTAINLVPEVLREEQPEMVLRPRFASLSAELGPADLAEIDTLLAGLADLEVTAVKVIGHTDSQRIRPGAHPVYTDNHALSLARAAAVGNYISRQLHLSESQLAMYGMGAREPVADNHTAVGRAANRRVTLQVWTQKIVHQLPDQALHDHERAQQTVTGFRPGESWPDAAGVDQVPTGMPTYDEAWLASATTGERILWPPHGHLPHLPAIKLAVQHTGTDSLRLFLNGKPAGRLNFAGRSAGPDGRIAVSTWTGLDLADGDNLLAVDIVDARGRLVRHLERTIHYSGPPVFAQLVPERSRLVADGKSKPVVAVRLTDAMGYPARREVVGKFTVAAPHEAWREKGQAQRESITELQEKIPTYTIGPDGVALLTLAPTTTSGEAVLNLGLLDHEEELRVWLQPAARDWILTGVVSGTVGYNTVSGNLEQLAAADQNEDFYADGRLAFFAKGRLKGKWLLTLAYDSADPDRRPVQGLFGVVDPDAYYTVYGDAVVQRHDAPTTDHLYIRLEREQFYALYGDFNSGLTVTELGRYNRAMTGLRSSRRGEQLGFDVFASENRQNFRRDEIRGDGTSGLYRLTAGRLIPQSEKIILQVRDRYRSEIIISERHLTRSVDFTLDDLDGTLFFKEPIPSQDENFNPIWIVAEYETETVSTAEVTAGGRGFWRPGSGPVEVGVTGIREGTQGGKAEVLASLDTRWDLTQSLRLKAEYAGSDTRGTGRREAWFGELSQRAGPLIGRLYYRDQQAGFGLGHQNASESGTRKYGADARWQPHEAWRLDATMFAQRDLVSTTERHFGEMKMNHNSRLLTAGLGLRAANDEQSDGTLQQARQLTADASVKVLEGRGRIRLGREQAIAGQDDIADFPTRTTAGLEYEVIRNQKIFLAQELVDGGGPATHRTRLGVESVPWHGARLVSSAERRSRESDRRVFANLGLKQSLRLNDHWYLDGGLDHGRSTGAPSDSTVTATTIDSDFTAGTFGFTYRGGLWLVDQRLEYRTSTESEKWGLTGGVHVEPGAQTGLLASLRLVRTDYRLAGHHYLSDVSVGFSWRPDDNPWTILHRLSWRAEDRTGDLTALSNWRVVNNLNLLRMFGERDQLSTLIGVRYGRDTIAGRRYESTTDQLGLEWRHFMGSRWDIGARAAGRHAWRTGIVDYSAGLSGGYKLLEDIWLSLGYNFAGYRVRDFSAVDYTTQGPYLRFRVRLNQETTHEMLR